jgi:hypothetical protein
MGITYEVGVLVADGTVTNRAGDTISGSGFMTYGVYLGGENDRVINQSGAVIAGYRAVGARNTGEVVLNAGSIVGSGFGVFLLLGGTVANYSGGLISGGIGGVFGAMGPVAVGNYGSIVGTQYGVGLQAGGSVTNQSGGTISGGANGIFGTLSTVAVVNYGSVAGTSRDGVYLGAGGSVTNQSGGSISGGESGIYGGHASATVVNAGTISGGTGDAVKFAAGYANVLVIDPGAMFSGTVDGGNTIGATSVSTLELAGDGSGTLSGIGTQFVDFAQITVEAGASWTLTAANTIAAGTILTTYGALTNATTLSSTVTVAAGGELSNTSAGMVTVPNGAAVYVLAGAVAVVNGGSFAGGDYGVQFQGGSVTNQGGGTISGGNDGIDGRNDAVTLVNYGSVAGTGGNGVYLGAGGGVTNQGGGTISGGNDGIYGRNDAVAVVNYGSVVGTSGNGVYLGAGGSVTNQSGGSISGSNDGINVSVGAVTVVNSGSIAGTNSYGIYLLTGGSVTNQGGGTISGGVDGIFGQVEAMTMVNYGSVTGGTYGVADGQAQGAATVVNYGGITGGRYDVALRDGGSVINHGGGAISGGNGGVLGQGDAVTVVNAGSITGPDTGVALFAGGAVTNQSGGMISGGIGGIDGASDAVTVVNYGSISTEGNYGVYLGAGGSVTNQSRGSISGRNAFADSNDAATLVNAGSIAGTNYGVLLFAGGSITNQSGGTIIGQQAGIYGREGAVTVANAGTIAGAGNYAIRLSAGYTNRLIIDPGAVFTGTVTSGNTIDAAQVSTLELASGASAGTLSGIGTQFVDFAQTTVDAGASWVLTGAPTLAAGTTLSNAGTLTVLGTTLYDGGQVVNTGMIVIDPSSVTLTNLSGSGVVDIGVDSTLTLLGSVTGGGTIAFADNADGLLNIAQTPFADQITGFDFGDTIELTGVVDASSAGIVNADTLQILLSDNSTIDLALAGNFTGDTFAVSADGAVTEEAPCFLRGTRIRTESGEVLVQDLTIGDRILTLAGAARPITWIGTGRVLVSPGKRSAATPIIVRKNALADGAPYHDLRITKGHALFVDDVLIPAEFLINHRTILWDDHKREVEFYHIELETHDVLVANGAAAESYRDDGNRWLFQNANTGWDQPEKPPCAPVLTGGPVVDAIWQFLLDRAPARPAPTLTEDPDLHLLVDGARIDPAGQRGTALIFRLPTRPHTVRIVSRAASPAELGLARDPRRLGVAVTRIAAGKGVRSRGMEAQEFTMADGFHDFEPALGLRWTDGDAALPASLFETFDGAMTLTLHVAGSTRYPEFGAHHKMAVRI